MLEEVCTRGLSALPVEAAHGLAKLGMRWGMFAHGVYGTDESEIELFGVRLPNALGIAAGFDKYAQLYDVVRDYGFGWIEEGSFTAYGGIGNKKPRWFRLADGSSLNRMGLNCISADLAAERFAVAKSQETFAVSISKTNREDIHGDRAIDDILYSYNSLKNFGIYTALDVSCSNSVEGLTFQEPGAFRELVCALSNVTKGRPVVFKFSPGLGQERVRQLVEISREFADGYEAVNTLAVKHLKHRQGGRSGPALRNFAIESVRRLRELAPEKTILGVGGISTGSDVYNLARAGANVFLAFTGFCYKHRNNPHAGPSFAYKVNEEFLDLKRECIV